MKMSMLPALLLAASVALVPNAVSAQKPAPAATAVPAQYKWFVDSKANLVSNDAAKTLLASAGTYTLRKPDGSAVNLVASGGGNLVASGAGNLVASGAGNMAPGHRGLMSVDGKKVFVVQ